MKNLKQLFYLSTCLILIIACEEQTEGEIKIGRNPIEAVDNTISTDFNANKFSSTTESALLKELKICVSNAPNDSDEENPACSPKFFRFFPLAKNIPLKNGFILLIKAGVGGHPLRRILVFQREKGELVKLNGFNGNLIEQRPAKTGYNDIVVRFPDNIENSLIYYNCLFQWKNGKYEYVYCEVIDEGMPRKVKKEFIDSMGTEIKTILDKNNMIF